MSSETPRLQAVLEHYGADVPSGYGDRWRSLRCPFHEDRTASASYNESLPGFACMACQTKGNEVTLLMAVERLTAREADARATEIAGHPGAQLGRGRGKRANYRSPRLRRVRPC